VTAFDDQFDALARHLDDVGCEERCFETARELVADAVRLIRTTAPDDLPSPHAWLGAVQIVTDYAHRIAHEGMEAEA
jgi:hypothetical protein